MAKKKISELTSNDVPTGVDLLHSAQAGESKKLTLTKTSNFVMNESDYSPTVVNVSTTTHTIDTTIRKQYIIVTISTDCTFTFPVTYGEAKEIIIYNNTSSTANVKGLPGGAILYPCEEISFIWSGTTWLQRERGNKPGDTVLYAGSTAPSGWVLCDGSAISRTDYAPLFAIIGTTFGVGDGSTTFNVPDMRGATPVGVGTSTKYTQNETISLGQYDDDQIQGTANFIKFLDTNGGFAGASTDIAKISTAAINPNTNSFAVTGGQIDDGVNGTPRVGQVTHGKRIGLNFIIKA